MVDIDPREITGPWDKGYVLDRHTISSTMIGYNEFGYPEFDTVRSPLGELVYRLKYRHDNATVVPIAETVARFVGGLGICPEVVIPMPPSKQRPEQPLFEIGKELSKMLQVPLNTEVVSKIKSTPQMKDIGDYSQRVAALDGAFTVSTAVVGKEVLILDDLFQSGASMRVLATAIKHAGAKAVYCIALTRTRG